MQGYTTLCVRCHHFKHIGLSSFLADQDNLDYDKAIDHNLKANNCDGETVEHERIQAFEQ